MIVMKFGGTSVGSAERMKQVGDIVQARLSQKPYVVLSAVSGITDALILAAQQAIQGKISTETIEKKHKEILKDLQLDPSLIDPELQELRTLLQGISLLKELSPKTMDRIQSFGERMSVKIFAAYFTKRGVTSVAYPSYDLGLRTDDNFGEATPLPESFPAVKKKLIGIDHVAIITGFIAKTEQGEITTLGRGGSDYTAALIGHCIDAKEIQIWTDVDGVLSCDPRVVPHVKNIEQLSFDEASELSFFGAKVLHPKTILPAVEKNIPVRVLNTNNPGHKGTVILKESKNGNKEEVKVIAFKKNVTLVNIKSYRMLHAYGFLAKIFEVFSKYHISVDMLATSEVSISVTIEKTKNLDKAVQELSAFSSVDVLANQAIICIVGEGIKSSSAIPGMVFETLAKEDINPEMISQGSSEINIGFVTGMDNLEKAVKALHKKFFGM